MCSSFFPDEQSPCVSVTFTESGTVVNALIDTGSPISIVNSKFVSHYACVPTTYHLRTVNNQPLHSLGKYTCEIAIQNETFKFEFLVSSEITFDMIIGCDLISGLIVFTEK